MSEPFPQGRPLRALIDLEAFRHNIALADALSSQAKPVVVVKSNAYGHGMHECAQAAGSRTLAVATPEEAHCLVQAGIKNDIWVLEGPFSSRHIEQLSDAEVIWWVHSLWQLELLSSASVTKARVWLKLDTGMHRLGLQTHELGNALAMMRLHSHMQLEGVATHFANADVSQSESVLQQIERFDSIVTEHDLGDVPQSLCNSAGILHYPQAHRQWVRPGISLYGGFRSADCAYQSVMTLETAVMAIRDIAAGESVGYGSRWIAPVASRIATLAVGYGDGYPRHAPDGTPVLINGRRVPLAGRVSMDMITVDVSELSDVSVGDRVELWGPDLSVDEVAERAGTISYELLSQVTSRVPRVYR